MAKEIENNNLENIIQLLKENNVISKRKYTWDRKKGELKYSTNLLQIYFKEDKYHLIKFDWYGRKLPNKSNTIKESEIMKLLEVRDSYKLFYHKQRIPKSQINHKIIDEEKAKIMVYEWLLKKYKNEDDVIVPEISFEERRADYVAFSKNELCIVEIKSEIDTMDRLQYQIDKYIEYGNLIYIAIHKNKIDFLKDFNIPDFVGIIQITDKIKVIKKAKKQYIDFYCLYKFISYKEHLDMKSGLKGHSKLEKKDIELIFENNFTNTQKKNFIFNVLKNRHKKESNKRKEFYLKGDFKKSVGNAKNIGINRLEKESSTIVSWKDFFNLKDTFLNDYIDNLLKKIYSIYKSFPYIEIIVNDYLLFHFILKEINQQKRLDNSKIYIYNLLIENKKLILENKAKIIKFIENKIIETLNKSKSMKDNFLIIDIDNKETYNLIESKLNNENIDFIKKSVSENFKNIHNTEIFEGKKVLILYNRQNSFFYAGNNIEKINMWR